MVRLLLVSFIRQGEVNRDFKFGIQIRSDWPNGTHLGLFKISFSTFGLGEPKCTETDLKKSQICPILGPI